MLFSTKAEYGVRLMVELGRQPDRRRSPSSTVAEAERLPLSYLEHLVAKLRKAGLVDSTRGAHGGYRLARPAEEITLDAVVEALEGQIAPMECFHETPEGKVLCSHEATATAPVRRSCSGRVSRAASPRRWPGRRWPSWSSSRAASATNRHCGASRLGRRTRY